LPRPIRAQLDVAALKDNLKAVRRAAPTSRVWAVIKANAYGHGMARTVRGLRDADGFAVLDINDAVRLRDTGTRKPILLLEGFFEPRDLPIIADYRLHAVVHAQDQIEMLERTMVRSPLDVYLKMNTGMNRLGFTPVRCRDAYRRITARARVETVTLMTHFADADGESGVAEQLQVFLKHAEGIEGERSTANSAATLRYPETHFDWVRPGIALYGCSPFPDQTAEELGLRPVMTLTSRIIGVQEVQRGARVGYGGTFVASGDMRIGIVACGYGDGYPRHAPTGTPVLVEGRRTRTVGRVSMDLLAVDLTRLPEAGVDSDVTLWGRGLPAEEVAKAADTIAYEMLTALAARVPLEEI
jgi:alanine racemase